MRNTQTPIPPPHSKYIYILFILFIRHIPYSATAGSARNNATRRDKKERTKKKWIGAKDKPSTTTQTNDERMGEEEKNRKQKEAQKKETGSGPPTQLPGLFHRLLQLAFWRNHPAQPRQVMHIWGKKKRAERTKEILFFY